MQYPDRTTHPEYLDQLNDLLRIPSVSTDPQFAPDMRQAADWLVNEFTRIGLAAERIDTEGHPLVYAEWMRAGSAAPTVLVYGHYDVQPAVREDGWASDPFEPVEVDGLLFARGATDDKGQLFTHVKAVDYLLATTGSLPVNVKFLLEGEEESGGRSLEAFVLSGDPRLEADVCVISDTSMAHPDQPVIVNGLRGVLAIEVIAHGPATDLHSGMYGGSVLNPVQALATILASLHDSQGVIQVPGYYDDVVSLTQAERDALNDPLWTHAEWSEETGASVPWGDPAYTLRERVTVRPTIEISGFGGGYFGDGFKSIVPHKAVAKLVCRLVPDQEPMTAFAAISDYLAALAGDRLELSVRYDSGAPPVIVPVDNPYMRAAERAYQQGWGAAPSFAREGGSIPVVTLFQKTRHLPVIMMGFGLHSDGLHGPNEHFSIDLFYRGIGTAIAYLHEVAGLARD
jgi:acetylornithine deacetylase/succinyl-diaminopimelate desuccinylase-like protein